MIIQEKIIPIGGIEGQVALLNAGQSITCELRDHENGRHDMWFFEAPVRCFCIVKGITTKIDNNSVWQMSEIKKFSVCNNYQGVGKQSIFLMDGRMVSKEQLPLYQVGACERGHETVAIYWRLPTEVEYLHQLKELNEIRKDYERAAEALRCAEHPYRIIRYEA